MDTLEVVNRLYTHTRNGQREIQLCVGDITKLPVSEKVDVICISALPYNYVKTRTSVVGALYTNLGIDVNMLARHHVKEDLRKSCHCWISKPLDENLPYRQLICFEGTGGGEVDRHTKLRESVGDIFRAMMPVFNNENKSVITPLLATRIKSIKRSQMLETLVTSALQWMHIGLPLQCFKVVVYAWKEDDPEVEGCKKIFEQLRSNMRKIEANLKVQIPSPKIDIFIIYAQDDKELMIHICQLFKRIKETFKISSLYEITQREDTWQHDVQQEMVMSKRVVPLLTEGFLSSEICIDAYNVALCANRLCRRPLLAPFCLEQCYVPQHMAMVQWINCKKRDMLKVERAIAYLNDDIQTDGRSNTESYDVFLSYSHCNLAEAKQFLTTLQQADPTLKVFFDYDELKTGVSWQQKLYDAISGVPCVLALVSPDYMTSAVCQEEFNLAMAQHLAKKRTTELIPVMIKRTENTDFSPEVTPLRAYGGDLKEHVDTVCQGIIRWRADGDKSHIFSPITDSIDFHDVAEIYRLKNFSEFYSTSDKLTFNDDSTKAILTKTVKIHLSFVPSDQGYVKFFENLLQWRHPKSTFKFLSRTQANLQENSDYLTSVVFLSDDYVKSTTEMEELDVLLGKLRSTKDPNALYVVVVDRLPSNPLYPHLLPIQTSLLDDHWEGALESAQSGAEYEQCVRLTEDIKQQCLMPLSAVEMLGLRKVTCDVGRIISGQSLPDACGNNSVILNVLKTHRQNEGPSSPEAEEEVTEGPQQENHTDTHVDGATSEGADRAIQTTPHMRKNAKGTSKTCQII